MPRLRNTSSKVRLNLDLPQAARDALVELRDKTHADSLSEVVRRALGLYDALVTETDNGAVAVLRYPDGAERRLLLI